VLLVSIYSIHETEYNQFNFKTKLLARKPGDKVAVEHFASTCTSAGFCFGFFPSLFMFFFLSQLFLGTGSHTSSDFFCRGLF